MPEFLPSQNCRYYNHPVWKLRADDDRFPQITGHCFYNGFQLPCNFTGIAKGQSYNNWGMEAHESVGSAPRARQEVLMIAGELGVDENWEWDADDDLKYVKEACSQLLELTRISEEHQLPVVYWS